MSGVTLLVGVCGLSFSPHVEKDIKLKGNRRTMVVQDQIHDSLLRNGRYIACCICFVVYVFGIIIPNVHMSRYAQDSGLTSSQAANLYIGFGVWSVVGRILSGRILQIKSVQTCYVCFLTSLVAGIVLLLFPLAEGFIISLVFFSICGLCDGLFNTAFVIMITETCSRNQITRAYGWLCFIASLGVASGPPLGGFIADKVGSYVPAFYVAGSSVVLSAVIMMTTKCFKRQTFGGNIRTEVELLDEDDMIVIEKLTVL